MKIAIASSGLGHVARGIETWAADTAVALGSRRSEVGGQRAEVGGQKSEKEVSLAEAQRSQREKQMAPGTRELRVPGAVSLDMGSQMRPEPGISPAPAVSLRHSPRPLCAQREEMSANGGRKPETGNLRPEGERKKDEDVSRRGAGGAEQGGKESAGNARDARSWRIAHGEQELGDLSGLGERQGVEVTLFAGAPVAVGGVKSVALPCLRRGGRMARLLARVTPGVFWRYGLKSPYGWEQFSFWLALRRRLKEGGFDILHVQDPMLAWWCRRDREAGRLRTQEILAHGTEEPAEFLRQFPCVQHLAPWHLEQAQKQLGSDYETRERRENGDGDTV